MFAKPRVWMQFALVFVAICAAIGLSRLLPGIDFALALFLKGILILASVLLLWRMWRRGSSAASNGWLALLPPRMQAWVLGEAGETKEK